MRGRPIERCRAFAVHVFTASGAALALVALLCAVKAQWAGMFLCLGAALLVDGFDGPIARRFDVARVLTRWSGDTLDLVVDFTTYVFVPAYAVAASDVLPQAAAIPCAVVIVITGALYFADRDMKAADNSFRGFPAAWNIAVFYLFVCHLPGWIAAVTIIVLAALSFSRLSFVHPFRVRRLRTWNIGLMTLWALLAAVAVWQNLEPAFAVTAGLCAIALYFFGYGYISRTSSRV